MNIFDMKERPILFNAPMVNAILEGRKSQTRRVVKNINPILLQSNPEPHHIVNAIKCPYGQPGDLLWVRETWQHSNFPFGPYEENCDVFYRADYFDDPLGPDLELSEDGIRRKWKPSIHMPRSASRITLKITNVRVDRLTAISDTDAIAEGVESVGGGRYWLGCSGLTPRGYAALAYKDLWESINGTGSWEANPWIWVIDFKRIK